MKRSTVLFRLLCAFALCVLAGSPAFADVPYAPQNLEAQGVWEQYNNYTWGRLIYLSWGEVSGPDSTRRADYFNVYRAEGEKQDYTGFEFHTQLFRRYHDTTYYWPSGILISADMGTYSFYVDAVNADGTSEPSTIATITVADTVSLFFDGYPQAHHNKANSTAFVGEPYMYQVGGYTWSGGTVTYHLAPLQTDLPAGLAIDEDTGVLTWTPTQKGFYFFRIQISMPEYPGLVAEVVASIDVHACTDNNTQIIGVVRDQYGNPVTSGMVSVYPADGSDSLRTPPVMAELSGNGAFSLSVDEGSYIVLVDGSNIVAEYYEDATSSQTATVVEVECGEVVDIEMNVRRINNYTVSGRVTDQNGNGMAGVNVMFMGYNPQLPPDQRRMYPTHSYIYTASDGSYSIQLSEEYIYVAVARVGDTLFGGRMSAQVQFFDRVGNIAEAEELVLTADRSGVDFEFTVGNEYDNSISGRIATGDDEGVAAYIVAYQVGGSTQSYVATASGSDGMYSVSNLMPGNYVLYVAPYSGNISPGYYHEDGQAVYSWDEATLVAVGNDTDVSGINVEVADVDTTDGEGIVQGNVRGDASGIVIGKGDSGNKVLGSSALNGALITLVDSKGNVTRYNFSANNGDFSLSSLPTGVYTIIIDKIGFAPYKGIIEIKDSEPVIVDAVLEPEVTTGVGEPAEKTALARVFPNPVVNNAMLSFYAAQGTARISVVNTTGMEVLSLNMQTTDGGNILLLDTRELSSGAYFVRIAAGAEQYTLPLYIAR